MERIKTEEVLKIANLEITEDEFNALKEEFFQKIKEKMTDNSYPPNIALAFSSVTIGNLMALTNELHGVKGVLRLATEYTLLLNTTLLEINDELRKLSL